ncbi:MAG: SURF1 family protein [Chloroflexota bacterium]
MSFPFFSRRWLLPTVLALAGVVVLVRLGLWQLDRLEQRRAFNERVLAQVNAATLDLNHTIPGDIDRMEYRPVVLRGSYDFAHQVALRNQDYHLHLGAHLLTPFKLAGSEQAVLVDRGWIPQDDFLSGDWAKFDRPGETTLQGVVRVSQDKPDFGQIGDPTPAPGAPPRTAWRLANVPIIARQIPYSLLTSVYIQRTPEIEAARPVENITEPLASSPDLDLSEGNHQSYALQWFSFAAILALGYPVYVLQTERKKANTGKIER